ncbi:MAG: hypothetical protein FWB79_05445 [Treponema sp.]|nr:hypothetical protein [Treponema sp.]
MEAIYYERKLDFMDESVFPTESFCAQPENPDVSVSESLVFTPMSNEEIIDSVTNEMKDTLV